MIYLHDLPTNHTMRNTALAGCWYRWTKGKEWRQVKPNYGIARATYNDLGPAWTETSVFCWEPAAPNIEVTGRPPAAAPKEMDND